MTTEKSPLAQELFEASYDEEDDDKSKQRVELAEERLKAALQKLNIPCEKFGWDGYDCSIELYTPPDFRLSVDQQKAIYEMGFATAYVNHEHPEAWETHYHWKSPFEPVEGWRVSYPHNRCKDESGQIWVEKPVPSWPRKWFGTWWTRILRRKPYVLIKRGIKEE